jgi:hypothetical protein
MRKMMAMACMAAVLTYGTGCTTIAKRAMKEAKGASSDAEAVPGAGGGSFARFNGVDIQPPRTNLGGLVSTEYRAELTRALREQLVTEDDAPFKGSSPRLTIDPEILWYYRGGSIMPEKFAVVLFWLKDGGADVGRVQIVTKSEATGTGDNDMAENMAKELVSYFEDHGKKTD